MKNKSFINKALILLIITEFYTVQAVTSLFENKGVTYGPYEYRRSEFEQLTLQEKIDSMLSKVSLIEKKIDLLTKPSFHQVVKAVHAAETLEKSLGLKNKEKRDLENIAIHDSSQMKAQKRLEYLKAQLHDFSQKNSMTKRQKDILYRIYKHIELILDYIKTNKKVFNY